MPTMDDVARESGFSQMTVSRAFFDSAPIKQETRKRILEVASRMGYYHNRAASNLASQRSRAFGVILPTLQDSIYLHFVDGARRVFEGHNAEYILQTIDYARNREINALRSLLSQRVQAIILPSIGHTPAMRKLFQNVPVPLIEVGNLPKTPVQFAVGHSDFDAGYIATRRLIERGRREIAIICGFVRDTSNARDRLADQREHGHFTGERQHRFCAKRERHSHLCPGSRQGGILLAAAVLHHAVLRVHEYGP